MNDPPNLMAMSFRRACCILARMEKQEERHLVSEIFRQAHSQALARVLCPQQQEIAVWVLLQHLYSRPCSRCSRSMFGICSGSAAWESQIM